MDYGYLKGVGCLIEVQCRNNKKSHHWDFHCWSPNRGGRLIGVQLYYDTSSYINVFNLVFDKFSMFLFDVFN